MEYVFSYIDIQKPGLADDLADVGSRDDTIKITLQDNSFVVLPFRQALLNFIVLAPYFRMGMQIKQNDFMDFTVVSGNKISEYQTIMYDRILDEFPQKPHMEIVSLFWDVITALSRFANFKCQEYHQTVDILGLLDLLDDPEIKPIVDVVFDESLGHAEIEKQYEVLSKQLIEKLGTRGLIANNMLINFMTSGHVKAIQLPQNLMAYGTRSDIDGTMPKHVISESALSGLKTVQDFAVEAIAARKSQYYNKGAIKESQYNSRKLRMVCSFIKHIYPGDCGSRIPLIQTVPRKGWEYFLGNAIYEGPEEITLTVKNIQSYIGKSVAMVSPCNCRYTDGFCEHCCGWGKGRASKYLSPGINIGTFSASKVGGPLGQLILSAKHLSKTASIVYVLPEGSKDWFIAAPGVIFIKPSKHKESHNLVLKIPAESMGVLSDLDLNIASEAENYSDIYYVNIGTADDDDSFVDLSIATESCVPFLSSYLLTHMQTVKRKIRVENEEVIIPLKGFDPRQPIFQYVPMSADMIAFTAAITSFFNRKMSSYTSISKAITDFTHLLFSKSGTNMFYIQAIFKAFLRHPMGGYGIPQVTDPENVCFANMQDIIQARSSYMLLGFEAVRRYISNPSSYLDEKGPSVFDAYFGEIPQTDIMVLGNDEEDLAFYDEIYVGDDDLLVECEEE